MEKQTHHQQYCLTRRNIKQRDNSKMLDSVCQYEDLKKSSYKENQQKASIIEIKNLLKLTRCKSNQAIIQNYYRHYDESKLERCVDCGSHVWFIREGHTQTLEERLRLGDMKTCQLRFCSVCTWRRQVKFSIKTHQKLTSLEQSGKKLRYLFLTLTVKNPKLEDLKDTIKQMQKSFGRMVQRKRWKDSIEGYCRVLEVTVAEDANYTHPHFHVLLAVRPNYFRGNSGLYLSKDVFSGLWQDALRADYKPVCDVRIVKPRGDCPSLIAAVVELIKYPIKDTDLKKLGWRRFKLLEQQYRDIRAINYGGILKGEIDLDEDQKKALSLSKEENNCWMEIERWLMKYDVKKKKYERLKTMQCLGKEKI